MEKVHPSIVAQRISKNLSIKRACFIVRLGIGTWMRTTFTVLVVACCLICPQAQEVLAAANPYGEFTGTLKLQPTGDGVRMLVLEAYSYSDADGHTLTAGPGFPTDGASIPRALWTIVGSPFTGTYIGAAVIHDVGCDTHQYSWQTTHRMFYTAMRRLGVSDNYAKLLYWGVRIGGPKWQEQILTAKSRAEIDQDAVLRTGKVPSKVVEKTSPDGLTKTYTAMVQVPLAQTRELSEAEVQRIAQYISVREPSAGGAVSLDEIDAKTPLLGDLPENAIPK
jgi:hypothetical protein